mmetsp:Transcript_21517/g.26612  ORF Transcript_21517/g.26612 Transcript_21517/m.26612 type:complete len:306 (-) Transcript_21517:155-1072(-)|eukprot:CAMPEP_0172517116 /NCGR_PEP_ID=MMETSP1066-20121228/281864_1 /TAXON_ID=671091 /ORGANISM="Coscinodiscus wailesii, Strain CCMP2513" /LENGTH=305 /DNA_ID=CAMNT_0013298917 /DNA_START=48 /DNA_END=965 /DNA_ORIENTATION=+
MSVTPNAPHTLAVPSGQASQNLLLDSSIRDWVVLPLLIIMITAGLLRHYLGQLLRAKTTPLNIIETRSKSCLQQSARLRSGGAGFLSRTKFEARRRHYSNKEHGLLRDEAERAEEESEEAKANAKGDNLNPMSMMDGMKGNMVFMVQNMVMMQGISHFFKGYVLLKVPFPLTNGFKMMFQRGLDLTTLETSYVSSVSWYFLVMFGLRAFFVLAIGDMSQEMQESVMMQASLGNSNVAQAPGQQFNAPNALKAEADNLEMLRYKSTLDDAEKRLLGKRYPKKKMSLNPGDDIFGYGNSTKKSKRKQ